MFACGWLVVGGGGSVKAEVEVILQTLDSRASDLPISNKDRIIFEEIVSDRRTEGYSGTLQSNGDCKPKQ